MANYLSLEEAAAKLGIPADHLVDLRSQGKVRGFRDGTSWKFPEDAIDNLAEDLAAAGGGSGVGSESLLSGGDAGIGDDDSDFLLESEGEDLLEIDSSELQLNGSAISHDSAQLDLAVEPNAGSTGPVTEKELEEISESHPDVLPSSKVKGASDSGFTSDPEDHDSGDELIGVDDDSSMGVLGSGLELLDDSDDLAGSNVGSGSSPSADVLDELDLLGAEQQGSGLIHGDSGGLSARSGVGSGSGRGSNLSGIDDDLVISDDDDDLVLGSAGSDISVAGDSGINLMSPSDSGLSLESEPLDLAGSSISALDLGAELGEGSGSGSGGSDVQFDADEEFQLSPSGIGIDADVESGSQVIEVEDSEAIGEPVEFGEADPLGGDVFGADEGEAVALDGDEEAIAIDETSASTSVVSRSMGGYEVPFTMLQCLTLMLIICVLSLGGMMLTDLVRNMWAYAEPTAPVSSLTDAMITVMGWDK